ncbi:hypothetical protein U7230_11425 [Carboxydochorda subterranea]|uniref:Uncharacterized protein n=1 Tax=Carboxydichorda subterranea TaxID=3109565 RepID=A0ABZ1BVX4_9FIRM|nr:hypothetical protein [Limnochorda sp. L945t]WRP16696.1 hypothetical protein U7230_11425 [Limnochorda sp. L945t]
MFLQSEELRYAMQSLCRRPVEMWPSLDFRAYAAHLVGEQWLLFAFSQSGETRETVEAPQAACGRFNEADDAQAALATWSSRRRTRTNCWRPCCGSACSTS